MRAIHAVVTVLEPRYYSQVESIWNGLSQHCGVFGVRGTPIPHFSWQIAGDYDFDRIESVLGEIAQDTCPFTVHTAGIDVFAGDALVVYVKIVKSDQLTQLHNRLWTALQPLRRKESPYYEPGRWVPHITLAEKDVTTSHTGCVMEYLSRMEFRWEVTVANLGVICQPAGSSGVLRFCTQVKNVDAQ